MPVVYPTGWPLELRFRDNAAGSDAGNRRADPWRQPTPPGGSPELRFRDNAAGNVSGLTLF